MGRVSKLKSGTQTPFKVLRDHQIELPLKMRKV
jgi:hypothetical protein